MAHSFPHVFQQELNAIDERRAVTAVPQSQRKPEIEPPNATLQALEESALERNLCGLALSGGGIRSATFALGVLQGLAAIGLLKKFDYLSTVSGGGYIGSWLSAFVNRKGFTALEKALIPPSFRANEQIPPSTDSEEDGRPIRHLRLFSNYLAPRWGYFSFDSWTLLAIGLRNLLLNQLVLMTVLQAVILLLRLIVELFATAYLPPVGHRNDGLVVGVVFCVVGVIVAMLGTDSFASRVRTPERMQGPQHRRADDYTLVAMWLTCVVPWIFVAAGAALILISPNIIESLRCPHPDWKLYSLCMLGFVVVHAVYSVLSLPGRRWIAIPYGAISGFVGATLFVLLWRHLLSPSTTWDGRDITVALVILAGVPLEFLILLLCNFLMVGLCGTRMTETEREWWASLTARGMMVTVVWTTLAFGTILGPWLFAQLLQFPASVIASVATSWSAIILGGLKAAKGSQTVSTSRRGFLEYLTACTLPLFLMTLLAVTTYGYYEMYAAINKEPSWAFGRQIDSLLENLNYPHSLPLFSCLHSVFKHWPLSYVLADPALNDPQIQIWPILILAFFVMMSLGWWIGRRVGVNTFSLQSMYANRLIRCYLGATNEVRRPTAIVNLDANDDMPIANLFPGSGWRNSRDAQDDKRGPFHIINAALNQRGGTDAHSNGVREVESNLKFQERMAESFTFSPIYCGSESTGYVRTEGFGNNISLGTAVSVSGAAVSPNMGYHSSPSVTALLTAFNLRLGAWFRNPKFGECTDSNPPGLNLLISEIASRTSSDRKYVYLSDGGHFENVGVYELVRRRCRFIVAVDSGADPTFQENFGRVVRQVRIDFGIRIEIDMAPVSPDVNGRCASHVTVGRIHYEDVQNSSGATNRRESLGRLGDLSLEGNQGVLVWIKNGLTGDEPVDLLNYAAMHSTFPYDTTLDQFFNESQFESYRALGWHSVTTHLRPFSVDWDERTPADNFRNLYEFFLGKPPQIVSAYVSENNSYAEVLRKLHTTPALQRLAAEIYDQPRGLNQVQSTPEEVTAERLMCIEMFTLLENVWLSLDLDHRWNHPLCSGWMKVFERWTNSNRLNRAWEQISPEFSPAFRRFVVLNVSEWSHQQT